MSILRDYAATVRSACITKAVIRFETEPGRQAQVDWKECGRWLIDGEERKVYAFVMLLGYSRKPCVLFTTGMTSPILLAAHNRAFEYFQGVPAEILYDNMKTAWLADGDGWKVNPKLLAYASQIGFKPLRCQVRRPQTKGKVERFIGYLGNHFLPVARQMGLASIADLNAAVSD
jgi:transposase